MASFKYLHFLGLTHLLRESSGFTVKFKLVFVCNYILKVIDVNIRSFWYICSKLTTDTPA